MDSFELISIESVTVDNLVKAGPFDLYAEFNAHANVDDCGDNWPGRKAEDPTRPSMFKDLKEGVAWFYHCGIAIDAGPQKEAHVAIEVNVEARKNDQLYRFADWSSRYPVVALFVVGYSEEKTTAHQQVWHDNVQSEDDSGCPLWSPKIHQDYSIGWKAQGSQKEIKPRQDGFMAFFEMYRACATKIEKEL